METRTQGGSSSFAITAALSFVLLIFAIIWSLIPKDVPTRTAIEKPAAEEAQDETDTKLVLPTDLLVSDKSTVVATSTDGGLSPLGDAVFNRIVGAYASISAASNGEPSDADKQRAAQYVLKELQPVVDARTYTARDVRTTTDTSVEKVLEYRAKLRDSLAPLLKIPEPEYASFGRYVQSHDASALQVLHGDAELYRQAASSTAAVEVPQDALSVHIGILNAMEQFAVTINAMAAHADDPFAMAAILRTYNQQEEQMVSAFNALAIYYRTKAGTATPTNS